MHELYQTNYLNTFIDLRGIVLISLESGNNLSGDTEQGFQVSKVWHSCDNGSGYSGEADLPQMVSRVKGAWGQLCSTCK